MLIETARRNARWLRRLVRCHGRTQNENGLDRPAIRPDVTVQHETTNSSKCVDDFLWANSRGFRQVPQLLGMMNSQCLPELRDQELERTPHVRDQLLALERLWKSLGHPTSELWQRLYFYDNDNFACSYKSDARMTPNVES